MHNVGKIYITNGVITKQFSKNKQIPFGWKIGKADAGKYISITDGIKNKKFPIDDIIPVGWKRGCTKNTHNRYK